MRLTFIGYGSIAESHLEAFRAIPGVELDSVVGRLAEPTEAFARTGGFQFPTTHLDEALARPGIDAVVITSPSELHASQAEACLRAGKDVLAEIPLAMGIADAERLVELAAALGRTLMVAHTQRFSPALLELRRRVGAGELTPHHAVCRWFFLRRENINWKGRRRSWVDNLLWHHACHVVDAMIWLLGGEADAVRAQAGPDHPELRIPLDLDIQFRLAGRLPVTIAMSYNSAWPVHDYLVIGEEETLAYVDGSLRGRQEILVDRSAGSPILAQDQEFVQAARERRTPESSGSSVLPAMRVLQAAQDQI